MSPFHRLSSVVRGRRLLAAGAFLFLAYLFANNLSPQPRYVVQTGAKLDRSTFTLRGPGYWGTAEHLSDDGRQVMVAAHQGDFRIYDTRLELWEVRTGADRTPRHWQAKDWQDLLWDGANWTDTGLMELLSNPSGREILCDEASWAELRRRFTIRWDQAGPRRRRPGPAADDRAKPDRWWPKSIRFSPDGRFLSYVSLAGWPLDFVSDVDGDGTTVEDVRTGQRIAMLRGVKYELVIAPGGRTAVSRNIPDTRVGEQPWLTLWDLETSTRRAELLLPEQSRQVGYSPNGRYVFATTSPYSLRWWDTETGRQVSEVGSPVNWGLLNGGRVLVVNPNQDEVLDFWEVATGQPLGDWELDTPSVGRISQPQCCGNDRYLIASCDPTARPMRLSGVTFLDRGVEWLSDRLSDDQKWHDRQHVLVLDAVSRRAEGVVPGRSGTVSPNGRWLAALDADGVVRVWDLPIGRPWVRGFAYASAVFGGGWLVFGLPRRVWRGRAARGAPAEPSTASPFA